MELNDLDLNDQVPEESPAAEQVVEQKPYAAIIRSKVLGEDIMILKDRTMLNKCREDHPGMVIYLPDEIKILDQFKDDESVIRIFHIAKKEFGGWIY